MSQNGEEEVSASTHDTSETITREGTATRDNNHVVNVVQPIPEANANRGPVRGALRTGIGVREVAPDYDVDGGAPFKVELEMQNVTDTSINPWLLLQSSPNLKRIRLRTASENNPSWVPIEDCEQDEYRLYSCTVNTKHKGATVKRGFSKSYIHYKIMCRGRDMSNFYMHSAMGTSIRCCFSKRMQDALMLASRGREMPANSSRPYNFDLMSVLQRAAACMMQFSLTGTLTETDITGQTLGGVFYASSNAYYGAEYIEGCVYVPPEVYDTDRFTSSTLVRLVWGCGSNAAICNARVAGESQTPVLEKYDMSRAVESLHKICESIILMYTECGRATDAYLCYASGLHSIATVMGHTLEGGIMRDIFRKFRYVPPCGPFMSLETSGGAKAMPRLQSTNGLWTRVASRTDSFLLATAALVSISDPCITINGYRCPTIIQCTSSHPKGTPAFVSEVTKKNSKMIVHGSDEFSKLYCANLAHMVGLGTGYDVIDASYTLMGSIHDMCDAMESRHLAVQIMSPWTWIEPTGLFPNVDWADSKSTEAGFGLFCKRDKTEILALANCQLETEGVGVSRYLMPGGPLRQHGYIQHILKAKDDGLVFMDVHYDGIDGVMMRGGSQSKENIISAGNAEIEGSFPIETLHASRMDTMLWGRKTSDIIAPNECVFTSEWVLEIRNAYYDPMRSRTVEVLDGDFDSMCNPIIAWATAPMFNAEIQSCGTTVIDVEQKAYNTEALIIARTCVRGLLSDTRGTIGEDEDSFSTRREMQRGVSAVRRAKAIVASSEARGVPTRSPNILKEAGATRTIARATTSEGIYMMHPPRRRNEHSENVDRVQ